MPQTGVGRMAGNVVIADSNTGLTDDYMYVGAFGNPAGYGQTFEATGGTLHSVKILMSSSPQTRGKFTARVYPMTGEYGKSGVPSGAPIASSAPVDASTIPSVDTMFEFVFQGAVPLTAGKQYVVTAECDDAPDHNQARCGFNRSGNCVMRAGGWIPDAHQLIYELYVTA